ncbi:MAG: hypothetical protein CL938_08705, partial [Deltaproteobacteria bacterium]|nr:hypothetical protein [Deltaproteobacteria bacterium]
MVAFVPVRVALHNSENRRTWGTLVPLDGRFWRNLHLSDAPRGSAGGTGRLSLVRHGARARRTG